MFAPHPISQGEIHVLSLSLLKPREGRKQKMNIANDA
jgi:hypothetical protein